MAKSPAQIVKDKFGDKQKLVDAVKQFVNDDLWVARENKDKGLARVSNAKLLRLLDTFTTVQAKWGTRAKLIDAIVDAAGRSKDAGYRARIESWPVPRLYDQYRSLTRAKGQTSPKASKPAKQDEGGGGVVAAVKKTAKKAAAAVASAATGTKKGAKSGKAAAPAKKTGAKKTAKK